MAGAVVGAGVQGDRRGGRSIGIHRLIGHRGHAVQGVVAVQIGHHAQVGFKVRCGQGVAKLVHAVAGLLQLVQDGQLARRVQHDAALHFDDLSANVFVAGPIAV